MGVMFDSVDVDTIPSYAEAVAGYVGGRWPTFASLEQRFPHAQRLSIAINAAEDAEALDVEIGDADTDQVPAWVRRQQARGVKRPVVYSSVSRMPGILTALAIAGVARENVRVWTAHYTSHEHLCSSLCEPSFATQADATQWTDKALDRNLDQSMTNPGFFAVPASKPALDYSRFPDVPVSRTAIFYERRAVKRHDALRAHPHRNAAELHKLHAELVYLRKRVWFIAHHDPTLRRVVSPPRWNDDDLGWRWHQLAARTR